MIKPLRTTSICSCQPSSRLTARPEILTESVDRGKFVIRKSHHDKATEHVEQRQNGGEWDALGDVDGDDHDIDLALPRLREAPVLRNHEIGSTHLECVVLYTTEHMYEDAEDRSTGREYVRTFLLSLCENATTLSHSIALANWMA